MSVFGRTNTRTAEFSRSEKQTCLGLRLDVGGSFSDTEDASLRIERCSGQRGKPKGLSRFYIVASSRRRRLRRRTGSGIGSTSDGRMASASWIIFTCNG